MKRILGFVLLTLSVPCFAGHTSTHHGVKLSWVGVMGLSRLLLGIRHPAKVKKIAAMAANLNPSENALRPEVIAMIRTMVAGIPEPHGTRLRAGAS
jgi:hypothetical protein